MNPIAKTALASLALLSLSAGSGAAILPAFAAADASMHTKRLIAYSKAEHQTRNHSQGTDLVRSRGTHTFVGYDTFTIKFNEREGSAAGQVALAFKDGIITFRVKLVDESHFRGPILAGSGRYKGIEGTVTGRATGGLKTFYTLRYHL